MRKPPELGPTGLLPSVAIVGRPNVGKSTLFNQLTRSRDALVADVPGLTRDRQFGLARFPDARFIVIDTGGLSAEEQGIAALVAGQVDRAATESDLTLLVLDAHEGLTAEDERVAARLRRLGVDVAVVVNKIDGIDPATETGDFHRLGLGDLHLISAAHGRGIQALVSAIASRLPASSAASGETDHPGSDRVLVGVVGRPNVGKSSLINRLVGEERVLAHDAPGTTRDSILVPFDYRGRRYTLIDTAGVRRRGRVQETVEKFSVVKTLQAIEAANVVILVVDAVEGLSEQDLKLLGHVIEAGRGLVVALNKWDATDSDTRRVVRQQCDRRLAFVDYAQVLEVSALQGSGLGKLLRAVDQAWHAALADLPTPELTRVLAEAISKHPPPFARGARSKLRYAHQGGRNPPRIVIHGTRVDAIQPAYERYLIRMFRTAFRLEGTPLKLEFRAGENPFKDRKNPLTRRQVVKRQRLLRHVKRRSR